jgi:hypothetical protein
MKLHYTSLILVLALATTVASAQHGHFVAGAEVPIQNAKLIAVNSNDFLHTFGYARTLTFSSSGTYAGYYNASCPFIVAAATPQFGGPELGAPALGSFIETEFVSLAGPQGGSIGYWEANQTIPTFTIEVGTTNGTNRFATSQANLGAGQPGADPYGHVHGRRFTANLPGFYTLAFRFWDTSTNGLNQGPIHAPSEIMHLYLQAGTTIVSITNQPDGKAITFGAPVGLDCFLEFKTNLNTATSWTEVQGPLPGDDHLHTFLHQSGTASTGFYRIRTQAP